MVEESAGFCKKSGEEQFSVVDRLSRLKIECIWTGSLINEIGGMRLSVSTVIYGSALFDLSIV